MRHVDSRDNKICLHNSGQPLGVECQGCGRRALAFNDAASFADLRGDMTRLATLHFRCTSCGGRDVQLWIFLDLADREKFVERPFGGPEF